MAAFVQHQRANLTLVALFADAPNESITMRAKGWLLQDGRHESVIIDDVDSAPNCAAALVQQAMSFGELAYV